MKETTPDINPHMFQRYFVDYFGMRPADKPLLGKLTEITDIADLLGFLERGSAGGLLLNADGEDYLFGMMTRSGRTLSLQAYGPNKYFEAEGRPSGAEVVLHPNPDYSYVRLGGSWAIRVNKEDEQKRVTGASRKRTKGIFLRPHTAVQLVQHDEFTMLGFNRDQVLSYIYDQFLRNIFGNMNQGIINNYAGGNIYDDVSPATKIRTEDFINGAEYESLPAISWDVGFCSSLVDGTIIDCFVRDQIIKSFPMPAFLYSNIPEKAHTGVCKFSLMFELP